MPNRFYAWWLSLGMLLAYLCTYADVPHAVDELSALSAADSWLAGQGWQVNQMEWDQARTPPQNAVGVDGNLYSKKGIGISLAVLPFLSLAKWWGTVGAVQLALLLTPLLTACLIFAFFNLVLALGYSTKTAWIASVALGLGTLAWPYSRTLFSEPLAMLGLGLSIYGMVVYRRSSPPRASLLRLVGAGCGFALFVLAKPSNAVLLPGFVLYLGYVVWIEQRSRLSAFSRIWALLSFSLPVLLGGVGVIAYNYLRFRTLFNFPLESFEQFSTPLAVGLTGLLISPGKGLFWYVPLVWLAWPSVYWWRQAQRAPDFLLAVWSVLSSLILYAGWYDWPGGRAWGPRMIALTMPALVMLTLPAIEAWGSQQASHWQKRLLFGLLGGSLLMQTPGVLVNFEQQEGLDMQAGRSFEQLLWHVADTPLLTYWSKIGGRSSDPIWLQPYFWSAGWWPLLGLALCAGIIWSVPYSGWLGLNWAEPLRSKPRLLLLLMALLMGGLATGLVIAAGGDPRWHERSAALNDNQALAKLLQTNAGANDRLLLDLLPQNDVQGRVWFWLNQTRRPSFIGWLRKSPITSAADRQLGSWLAGYERVWLSLQDTNEGAVGSTTERWLDAWGFRGRHWWVGSQQLVEYLPPSPTLTEVTGPFVFGSQLTLLRYRDASDQNGQLRRIELVWVAQAPPDLRFSLQALDPQGQLSAQIDRSPGQLVQPEGYVDRVGLAIPEPDGTLILKVYQATSGQLLLVQQPDGTTAEFLRILSINESGDYAPSAN
jgi:hypothetical protein